MAERSRTSQPTTTVGDNWSHHDTKCKCFCHEVTLLVLTVPFKCYTVAVESCFGLTFNVGENIMEICFGEKVMKTTSPAIVIKKNIKLLYHEIELSAFCISQIISIKGIDNVLRYLSILSHIWNRPLQLCTLFAVVSQIYQICLD